MKKVLALVALAAMMSLPSQVWAQAVPGVATVVPSCGTPPTTYTPGQNRATLQDTNGTLCVNNGAGSATSVTVTAPLGSKASSASVSTVIANDQAPVPAKIDQTTPGSTNAVSIANVGATTVSSGNGTSNAGNQRVNIASDNSPVSGLGAGAIGAALPANAVQMGVNIGNNLNTPIACYQSVVYDASTSGSTQLVALQSGQIIYVCGYSLYSAGTVNVELDYGTGSACASGTTKIVPAYQFVANSGVVDGSPFYRGLKTAASNELCLKTSGGVAVQAIIYYAQF